MTRVRDEREIQRDILGWLESPSPLDAVSDCFTVAGWVFSRGAAVKRVWAQTVGSERQLHYGVDREDVARAYPDDACACQSGFLGFIELEPHNPQPRDLEIWAALADGREVRLFSRRLHYATMAAAGDAPLRALSRLLLLVKQNPRGLLSLHAWKNRIGEAKRALGHRPPAVRVGVRESLTTAHSAALQAFLASGGVLSLPRATAPRVSVVLVVWNRAELVFRCLRALSENTSVALEFIVVDNQSTDATPELLDRIRPITLIRNASNVGFTVAANQGAALATGEFILFLNSDAEPMPGSLTALLETLSTSPSIGAVGGKLVYPDGTLQEAGGIVWSDGACESYGRGQDPSAPEFCFERDVDYCSGAFLLTRRETFQGYGGFDERYRPAYYEDVDYCVRLWKDGLRVVYQAAAVAIHFEFGSASRADGVNMQIARRALFAGAHRDWLADQPSQAHGVEVAVTKRRSRRKVLIIDDILPNPDLGAGFPRAAALLRALQDLGFDLTVYATKDSSQAASALFRRVEVVAGRGPAGIREYLNARWDQYDAVIVSRPHNMRYLKAAVGRRLMDAATPVIYDAEAISAMRMIGRRRLLGELVEDEEAARLIRDETSLANSCAAVLAVNRAERQLFADAGATNAIELGHAVSVRATSPDFEAREGLLFVGAFDPSSPNEDAVRFLIEAILPAVNALFPDRVPVLIAGANIPEQLTCLARPGVSVESNVDDLTPLYSRARVFVAPVRYAAGIPLKVLEAASRGLPVVSSRLLAGQLGWTSDVDLLAADSPREFASAIHRVYSDRDKWEQLRAAGLRRVASDCDPQRFRATLEAALQASRSLARRS